MPFAPAVNLGHQPRFCRQHPFIHADHQSRNGISRTTNNRAVGQNISQQTVGPENILGHMDLMAKSQGYSMGNGSQNRPRGSGGSHIPLQKPRQWQAKQQRQSRLWFDHPQRHRIHQ